MIRFACQHCGRQIEAPTQNAQGTLHCPGCLKLVSVPSATPAHSGVTPSGGFTGGKPPAPAAAGSGKGQLLALVGVIALLVVGIAGAGVWYLTRKPEKDKTDPGPQTSHVEGDGPEVSDMRLLPGNAQAVVTVRSAEAFGMPAVKDAVEQYRKRNPTQLDPIARLERDVGLKPDEVELLHVVGADVDKQVAWVVAKTVKPLDRDRILDKLGKAADRSEHRHKDRRYYLGKNADGNSIAVHFGGPKVLVVSDEAGMAMAMTQAAQPVVDGPLKPTIGLIDTSKSQMIIGLYPAGGGTTSLEGNDQVKSLLKAEWARVTLDATDKEATLSLTAKVKNKEDAAEVKTSLDAMLVVLRFAGFAAEKKTAAALGKFVNSAKVEMKGEEVRATATTDPVAMATVAAFVTEEAFKRTGKKQ